MAYNVLQSISTGSFAFGPTAGVTMPNNMTAGSKIIGIGLINTWSSGGGWPGSAPTYTTPTWQNPFDTNPGGLGAVIIADQPYRFVDGSTVPAISATDVRTPGGRMTVWAIDTPSGLVGTAPNFLARTDGTPGLALMVLEVSGLPAGTSGIIDGTIGYAAGNQGTTPGLASYASTATGEFLFNLFGQAGDNTNVTGWTGPAGYTVYNGTNNASSGNLGLAVKSSTGGTETGTFTTSNTTSVEWFSILFAIGAGGAPPPTVNANVTPDSINCVARVPFVFPSTPPAIVGTIGAASLGAAVNTAVTPAWSGSETRTAGNLLVLWVGGGGTATFPTTPAGWSIAFQRAGTSCSASIFYKIAAGADTAPTVAALASTTWSAQLAEFTGVLSTAPLDKTVGNSATSVPVVATAASADVTARELVLSAAHAFFSVARNPTAITNTYNNGATAVSTTNAGTSIINHYGFGYGVTTGNAAADSDSFTMTGTVSSLTGVALAVASFLTPTSVNVTPFTISCRTTIPPPIFPRSVTVTPAAIACVTTIPAPTVSTPAGGTGPVVLQTWNGNTPGSAVTSGAPSNNLTAGSKIICVFNGANTSTGHHVNSVDDGNGNAFSQIDHYDYSYSGQTGINDIWVLDTPVGDVGTKPTFHLNYDRVSASGMPAIWLEVAGLAAGSTAAACLDTASSAVGHYNGTVSGTASPVGPPSYVSSSSGEFLLYFVGDGWMGFTTWSAPAGYTAASANWQNNTTGSLLAAYKTSTGGTETGQWSWTGGGTFPGGLTLVAFKSAPTAAPPVRLQSWNAVQGGGVTQVSGTAGSNMTAGSTMICLTSMGVGSTETFTSVVDNLGNNFWKVVETPFNAFGRLALWALNTPIAQVGAKPTLTATKSGGGYIMSFVCQEVSNLPTATTLAALCDGTPLYTYAPLSIPVSPTNDVPYSSSTTGEYTIACYGDPSESGHTVTGPSGWTEDPNCIKASPNGESCCIAYRLSIGGLEAPNTWSTPNNEDWNQLVVSFKGAAGGGGTSVNVLPASIACVTTIPAPTVATPVGSINLRPNSIACVTTIPTPTPSGNAAFIARPSISAVTTIPPLSAWIDTNLSLSAIHAVTTIPPPSVSAGSIINVNVTPATISAVTTIPTLAGSASSTATPAAIAAVTAVPAPTVTATSTQFAGVPMAATAGMTVGTSGTQLVSVGLTAVAALNVSSSLVTEIASVLMTATTGLTVQAVRTQFAVVPLVAVTGLTVGSLVTESVSVPMTAAAALTVLGTDIQFGSVPLSATAGLLVTATDVGFATVPLAATASLNVAGAVTQIFSIPMVATTNLTVTATVAGAISLLLSGTTSLTISSLVTEVAGVPLVAAAALNVAGTLTQFSGVPLSATAGLNVAGTLVRLVGVGMAATSTLFVSPGSTELASVNLAATSGLVLNVISGAGISVILGATTSLIVSPRVTVLGQVNLSASSGLTVASALTALAAVPLVGSTSLVIVANAYPFQILQGSVLLSANTGLVVNVYLASAIPPGPPKPIVPYAGSGLFNPGDPYGGWTAPDETLYNIAVPQVPPYNRSP